MPVLVCHSARCNPTNWIDLHIARFPFLSVEPPWLSFPSAPCWHTCKHTRVRVVRYCSAPSPHVSLKKRSICKLMGRNGVFIQEKPQVKGKLEIRIYPSERTLPSLRSTSGRVEQTDGPGEDSLQPSDYQTEWDTHTHTPICHVHWTRSMIRHRFLLLHINMLHKPCIFYLLHPKWRWWFCCETISSSCLCFVTTNICTSESLHAWQPGKTLHMRKHFLYIEFWKLEKCKGCD